MLTAFVRGLSPTVAAALFSVSCASQDGSGDLTTKVKSG